MRLTGNKYTTSAKLVAKLAGDEEIVIAMPAGTTDDQFRHLAGAGRYHLDLDHRHDPARFGMEEGAVAQLFTAVLDHAPNLDGALATLMLTAQVPNPAAAERPGPYADAGSTIPVGFKAVVVTFAEVEVVHRQQVTTGL